MPGRERLLPSPNVEQRAEHGTDTPIALSSGKRDLNRLLTRYNTDISPHSLLSFRPLPIQAFLRYSKPTRIRITQIRPSSRHCPTTVIRQPRSRQSRAVTHLIACSPFLGRKSPPSNPRPSGNEALTNIIFLNIPHHQAIRSYMM